MARLGRILFPVLVVGWLVTVLTIQAIAAQEKTPEAFPDDGLDDFGFDGADETEYGDSAELDDGEDGDLSDGGGWEEEEDVAVDESDVAILTASNFTEVISKNEFVLVAFTASWCGHCKVLAPKYAAAATNLKSKGSKIVLAKCDAAVETSLAQEFNIEGFPTISFFINGKDSPYGGGRESDDIVSWLMKKTGPPAETIESGTKAKALLESESVLGAGFFSKLEGAAWSAFQTVAREHDGVTFVQFTDASLAPLFNFPKGVKPPAFAILKKDTEKFTSYGGEFAAEPLSTFVGENKLPLVITFSSQTADQIFDSQIRHQIILFAKPKDYEALSLSYTEAAKGFKGKAIFVLVDTGNEEESQSVVEFFGVDPANPAVMAFHADSDKAPSKYKYEGAITVDGLKIFVDGVLATKIKPYYKSDPIPEKNDDDVVVVVGKNFEDVVLDKTKDVLLEVYAPWCGHCQQLEPTYQKLGALFKSVDSVVIAKMDGTTNEHELAPVEGFPTLLFFPANKKENKTSVSAGRTLKALTEFIKSSASIKFTLPESSEKELLLHEEQEQDQEDDYHGMHEDESDELEDDLEEEGSAAFDKDEL
eukprot:TRINITY_DN14759_c0_g1_i1.p1 TRINITY_DN14759_c0_g1~~TRINITY_DN14759_c0_g1_i1.p1  ORF type:complete len:591 (+),score=159.76 TRINITY_DN14759_c0_g1_i1:95-1867(+)